MSWATPSRVQRCSAFSVADHWGDECTPGGRVGNNINVGLQYTDPTTQQVAFDKLADDGKVHEPLERRFWGAICGVVEDRFG